MDVKEIDFLVEAPKEDDEYEQELELTGVLLEEELMAIKAMCSEEKADKGSVFPFFIKVGNTRRFIGFFDLTFNAVIKLEFLSRDYTLLLIDKLSNRTAIILSKDNTNGDSLFKLITLN